MIFSEEIVDVDEGADEVDACQENSKNDVSQQRHCFFAGHFELFLF